MRKIQATIVLCAAIFSANVLLAQDEATPSTEPDTEVLDQQQWKQLDESVQRALQWLATQQQVDGSFKSADPGQPAVTSFCLMAFLAQGESPANGKYKQQLAKAIDFIAAQQKPNGLIATTGPLKVPIPRNVDHETVGQPSVYNHAISGLALCEAYGQCDPEQGKRIAPVIEKAIQATVKMQNWEGKKKHDEGGWRYLDERFVGVDSDLSITGWHLMFLRSAKNAGFDVPEDSIEAGVNYVENCFVEQSDRKVHAYLVGRSIACTRAMAGAGVLALAHAGKHNSKEARASGDWILKHGFSKYGSGSTPYDCTWLHYRFHYGSMICSQAMFQLGGKYWAQFFPPLVNVALANQRADGSWPPDPRDRLYGSCLSTSMCVLALSVPNQLLPIFQR